MQNMYQVVLPKLTLSALVPSSDILTFIASCLYLSASASFLFTPSPILYILLRFTQPSRDPSSHAFFSNPLALSESLLKLYLPSR